MTVFSCKDKNNILYAQHFFTKNYSLKFIFIKKRATNEGKLVLITTQTGADCRVISTCLHRAAVFPLFQDSGNDVCVRDYLLLFSSFLGMVSCLRS